MNLAMNYDVRVVDYGPRCVAMLGEDLHEGATYKLDRFYKDELVPVVVEDKPVRIVIVDSVRPKYPVLELESDYLALTPNFFQVGYKLFINERFITDLDFKLWLDIQGPEFRDGVILH